MKINEKIYHEATNEIVHFIGIMENVININMCGLSQSDENNIVSLDEIGLCTLALQCTLVYAYSVINVKIIMKMC